MKRLAIGALASLVLLAAGVPASAQFGAKFGEIYFSDTDNSRGLNYNEGLQAFAQFEFFLVIEIDFADDGRGEQNVTNGISGWEAQVNQPMDLTILGRTLRPATSLNVGSTSQDNYIVGTGQTVKAVDTPFGLVQFQGGLFLQDPPTDLVVTLSESTPASFGDPEPHWLEPMQGDNLHQFPDWSSQFIVNCTDCNIATETSSFGAVKAKF